MTPITTFKYNVNGVVLNVAEVGSGSPLLLIHGWTNDWRGWTLLADELSKKHRLYMIDLPGFGESQTITDFSLDSYAKIINNFLQIIKIKPVAVIGASLGSIVAAKFLENYPHNSNTLIELGAVFSHDMSFKKGSTLLFKTLAYSKTKKKRELIKKIISSNITAYFVEYFLNAYKFDRQKVERYSIPGRKLVTANAYIELGLSANRYNLAEFLKTTSKNTLLIYGSAEKYVNPEMVREYFQTLNKKNLALKIIPECGHNPAYEKPRETAKIIADFLQN